MFFLLLASATDAVSQGGEYNKAIPDEARLSLQRAQKLADQEKFPEALAEYKKAIAAAPHFLLAHVNYLKTKAYFMEEPSAAKEEYENLATQNPRNPVYPAALALGLVGETDEEQNRWLKSVAELAPDWAWGHYAKGLSLQDSEPAAALAEYFQTIEKDSYLPNPYRIAVYLQDWKLNDIDGAITTAEKMLRSPELRLDGMSLLWRLRLKKKGNTEEAKTELRNELSKIAAASDDVPLLATVREDYIRLKDESAAQMLEEKIKRLDPLWYPERGRLSFAMQIGNKGVQNIVTAGRQLAIQNKLKAGELEVIEPAERIERLEHLLSLNPNNRLKKEIYFRLFGSAVDGDTARFIKYGELLVSLDPEDDLSILPELASVLANQKRDFEKALAYARRAEELTREPRIIKSIDGGAEANKLFQRFHSEARQMDRYNFRRAAALDALGYVLFKMGKPAEAEAKAREAIKFQRSENNLTHLAQILRALKRDSEAESFALEAKNQYRANFKSQLKNEPIKDFELATIDGRKIKLSDLKGKIVMVNFWATWCKPCLAEMPLFVKTYEKYKNRGLEILAISVDAVEDRPKVVSLAQKYKINFPLLYDENVAKLYGVNLYPTTFFVGKQGTIRFNANDFSPETAERYLEIIIEELMKDN